MGWIGYLLYPYLKANLDSWHLHAGLNVLDVSGTLVDLVGLVVYVGRWEREVCLRQPLEPPTGQYWVRVWLRLADHTTAGNVTTVPVRMYVDRER